MNLSHRFKYLGLQVDRNEYFKEHLSMAVTIGKKVLSPPEHLIPNIGGLGKAVEDY